MKPAFQIFIILMLAGNCFGLYQLFSVKSEFISTFSRLNEKNYTVLQVLPVINIIALTGLLLFKGWAPWLVMAGSILVIAADIYFGIRYHLYLAVPSALILLFFIFWFRNHFK